MRIAWLLGLAGVAVVASVLARSAKTRPSMAAPLSGATRISQAGARFRDAAARGDAHFDRLKFRASAHFGTGRPAYLAAYRGFADASGCEIMGRVLADPPPGLPATGGSPWRNFRDQWARFESDEVPGVTVEARLGDAVATTVTDAEGYYRLRLPMQAPLAHTEWRSVEVSIPGSDIVATHAVLAVSDRAEFGIISDIDDTVLDSKIVDWKASARLTFLHNARSRKPLPGVAQLYRSLQRGRSGDAINPLFYVSSSPWNLYDLIESFMTINEIPPGPILLRDLGIEPGYFISPKGHAHKLENLRRIFAHYPELRWLLVGDSGQADAEIYAAAASEFPGRVHAIYIRDVDPDNHSPFDRGVDSIIGRTSGVPMLRVRDSESIAEHARSIGLLPAADVAAIERDVARDKAAPPQVAP